MACRPLPAQCISINDQCGPVEINDQVLTDRPFNSRGPSAHSELSPVPIPNSQSAQCMTIIAQSRGPHQKYRTFIWVGR